MKKPFLSVLAAMCLLVMGTAAFGGKRLDLTNTAFSDIGNPMWVVERSKAFSATGPMPLQHIEAVRAVIGGYITQTNRNSEWITIEDVKPGDILLRHYQPSGASVIEILKPAEFLEKYVLESGAEIRLDGEIKQAVAPRVSSRAEATALMRLIKSGALDGVNYGIIPEDALLKVEVRLAYDTPEHIHRYISPQPESFFRLAPQNGFIEGEGGQKIAIKKGSLLKYTDGKINTITSPDFYQHFTTTIRLQLSPMNIHEYILNPEKMEIPTFDNASVAQVTLFAEEAKGPKQSFSKTMESFLQKYKQNKFINLPKANEAVLLPEGTLAILESYERYTNVMDKINKNFSLRGKSAHAAKALELDIAQAKIYRAQTRELVKKYGPGFETALKARVSSRLPAEYRLAAENIFRRISRGTLLSVMVVGGLQAVEALLANLSEPDMSADMAQVMQISVRERDSYLQVLKTNPQLLVYMPQAVIEEAVLRQDFDQPALAAELYLFNQFSEELDEEGSVAQQIHQRVVEESKAMAAEVEAEKVLAQAAAQS
ncbi:hypothetical protein [Candidatus Avelusimicrobium sp.]